MSNDLTKTVYLECKCNDFDHVVRVSLWDWQDKDPPEVLIDYRLSHHESFWDRFKSAMTYLFGYKGETLVYHDMIVDDASMDRLSQLCRDYKLAKEVYELSKNEK